jgi:hypothetical protein
VAGVRPSAGVAAAILSLASLSQTAWAQAPQIDERPLSGAIAFAAGATCLEQSRLEAQVQTWLGRDRIPSDVRLDVRGDDRDPRAVGFRISRSGKTHERRFDHLPESCSDATAILGLAIALAIDAGLLAGVFALPSSKEQPRRLVAIEVGAGFDVVPGASVGGGGGIEYGLLDWLSGRLDVGSQFSWGNSINGTSGVFDAALVAIAPQICAGGAVMNSLRVELCSGAAIGILHAQGHGFATPRSATGLWVGAQGGLRLVLAAGVSWVLDLEGVFPVHVPEFRAESGAGQPLYRQIDPTGALLSAGPVFFF